jgi:hypothetical protein
MIRGTGFRIRCGFPAASWLSAPLRRGARPRHSALRSRNRSRDIADKTRTFDLGCQKYDLTPQCRSRWQHRPFNHMAAHRAPGTSPTVPRAKPKPKCGTRCPATTCHVTRLRGLSRRLLEATAQRMTRACDLYQYGPSVSGIDKAAYKRVGSQPVERSGDGRFAHVKDDCETSNCLRLLSGVRYQEYSELPQREVRYTLAPHQSDDAAP